MSSVPNNTFSLAMNASHDLLLCAFGDLNQKEMDLIYLQKSASEL